MRQRKRALDELRLEIHDHLERETQDNIDRGMTPEQARREALLKFGSITVVQENARAVWRLMWLEHAWRDLRHACRTLCHSPSFTAIAVLTLALGIGVNTFVFSILNAVVFRPLPIHEPDRVVFAERRGGGGFSTFSFPLYREFRDRNVVFDGLVGYRMSPVEVDGTGAPARTWAYLATGNYFDVLGIKPRLGRFFHPQDDIVPGAAPLAILSFDYWKTAFGSSPAALGATLRINRHPYTVIGVAPEGFHGTEVFYRPQLWVPMMMQAQIEPGNAWLDNPYTWNTFVLGRLKEGVSPAAAEGNLRGVMAGLTQQYPALRSVGIGLTKPGLMGDTLRASVQGFGLGILALAGLVLLASCANMATSLAARGLDRQREMAIRISLGAGRLRLAGLLLAETFVLSFAGGVVAFALAFGALRPLSQWRLPFQFAVQFNVLPDWRVFLFAFTVATVCGVLSGLAPLRQASTVDPNVELKGSGDAWRHSIWRPHDLLIGVQIALCCVIVTVSLVALRSLQHTLAMPLGFDAAGLQTMSLELALAGYDNKAGALFQHRVLDQVRSLPGVEGAAYASSFPLSIDRSTTSVIAEHPTERDERQQGYSAIRYSVSPGFFRTLRIPFTSGRDVDWRDADGATRVAVVNETFVHDVLHSREGVGRRFRYSANGPLVEIVGVVTDGRYTSVADSPQPVVFVPMSQWYSTTTVLMVRSGLSPDALGAAIQRAVAALDPSLPLYDAGPVERVIAFQFLPSRLAAIALSGFGVLAMALAGGGIYSVVALAVARRRRELGIRLALGASGRSLLQLLLGRTVVLATVAVMVGLVIAVGVQRALASVVYLAPGADPVVFVGAVVAMVGIALVASWVPMRRSLKADPVEALRAE